MGGLGETIYEQLSKLAQAGPETHGFRRGISLHIWKMDRIYGAVYFVGGLGINV